MDNSLNQETENLQPEKTAKESGDKIFIAGIGASAGGIQALREFFRHVPADSGVAYAVILHLSPDYESQLSQVLQSVAKISVTLVTERTQIQPNHVYVVSPNHHLTMEDGHINVSTNTLVEERRAPVDIFFRTLADSHHETAIAIILSGTGADGSMGLKRIKENNGAVFVQNPREAEYSDMPRNAIATGLADMVLNSSDIPSKIIAYKEGIGKLEIPALHDELADEQLAALRDIFTQLRVRTGHDFSNYKRATVLRRIERRINVGQMNSFTAYAAYLRQTPGEAQALLKNLLISVTNFFRDKDAFAYLETDIIPRIVNDNSQDKGIRIWVAGCATGEEAYSIAMLLYEQLENKDVPVQIFGSDLDAAAIAVAREGIYTLNDVADVSPERLRRFFTQETTGYRVRQEIRKMILFANHNILKDPPFSHVDMVTCRNVLIYLNHNAQNRVMETFHFALNPGGYLFIGSSESIDGAGDLYVHVSKEHQVFQSRHVTTRTNIPLPEAGAPQAFRIKEDNKEPKNNKLSAQQESQALERISLADLHQRLLEQYAPPSIVVNENYDVVHISETAAHFLQLTGGEPSNNVLKLVKQELRLELRTALYKCMQKRINIEVKNIPVEANNQSQVINLHVRPVLRTEDTARGFILIVFETSQEKASGDVVEISAGKLEPFTLQLEEELIMLKSQLHSSNEQFEIQTEELKASNEELQAMNEELRSSTEELETSKEELQSINEELITVNQELKIKVEEVSQSNNDFKNLINSIDIGTVFLDRNFRVKLFTPAVRDIFNLIQADLGRPLSDITSRLEYTGLLEDIETVLQKLQPIEQEVTVKNGKTYLMQVQPYRTEEDRINGVVITFINISQRKQAEEALRSSEERLRLLVESAKDYAIFTIDLNRNIDTWNAGAENLFKYAESEIKGKSGDILFTPEDRAAEAPANEAETALKKERAENERWHMRKDGSYFYGSGSTMPLRNKEGKTIGFVKIMRDLTESKKAEEALHASEERLRMTIESVTDYAIINTTTEGLIEGWNNGAERIFEYKAEDVIGKPGAITFTPEDRAAGAPQQEMQTAREKGYAPDERWHIRRDGSRFFMSGVMRPILNPDLIGYVKVARDITQQKLVEQQKDEFIAIASHELKTPVTSIKAYAEFLYDMFEQQGNAETSEMLLKLDKQVDRLIELIHSLLDTSQISKEQFHLSYNNFNLNDLVTTKIEETQHITKIHALKLIANENIYVDADKERIGEVVNNLISNAIKYSPKGGEIVVVLTNTPQDVQVSVHDNGIGISEDSINRIFERFYRVRNAQIDTFPGMGLGLYISAAIVNLHKGRIWVESKPGEGSTFYFTLPLNRK